MRTFGKLLAAAAIVLSPLAARAETLGEALVSAYNFSPLLKQNQALLRVADEDVAVALSALRPVLSYSASASKSWASYTSETVSRSLSLNASMLLFDFGASRLGVDVARESVLATRASLVDVEQTILYNAVAAYMNVIAANDNLAVQQNNLRLLDEQLKAANDRFDLGEITRTDVSLTESQRASAQASLISAQGDLQDSYEVYESIIGHKPRGALTRPPGIPQVAATLEAAKAIAVRTHPSIVAAQHNVNVAELGIKIARAGMLPTVSATASTARGYVDSPSIETHSKSGSVGIQLSGPIYSGGLISAQYRQAVAQRDSARAALLGETVTVKQTVGTAWNAVNVAAATLKSTQQQIEYADVAYKGVREELSLGTRTTLDLLDAEQTLRDAQSARIAAYSTYYTAAYALMQAAGLLTADHLNLAVVRYDPAAYYNAVKGAPVRRVSPQGRKLDLVLQSLGKK